MTRTTLHAVARAVIEVTIVAAFVLITILLLVSPAAADNCDIFINAEDCQNTAWTIGIIATAAGASATAVVVASKGKPRLSEDRPRFEDCNAAADWLNSTGEVGKAETRFSSKLGRPTRETSGTGGHSVSLDVTWEFNAAQSRTTLEIPRWSNMSKADKAAVKSFRDALLAHENGHHRTAKDYMSQARRQITGEGATPEAAQADLQRKLDEYYKETERGLEAANKAYDAKTDGGRNQAAIGGTNVSLRCPPGVS